MASWHDKAAAQDLPASEPKGAAAFSKGGVLPGTCHLAECSSLACQVLHSDRQILKSISFLLHHTAAVPYIA